jgi:gamma-glutamyl-gamma-aminobutyrate hydrolase PuuD
VAHSLSIVVEHSTDTPALDCMYAAQLAAVIARNAAQDRASIVRLRGDNAHGFSDTLQHVAPWEWIDRIAQGTLVRDCDEFLGSRRTGAPLEIVSINPCSFSDWDTDRFAAAVAARTASAALVRVECRGDRVHAAMHDRSGRTVELPPLTIDRYGRPSAIDAEQLPPELIRMIDQVKPGAGDRHSRGTPTNREASPSLKIVLIGVERNFRKHGPALLASVGDAADAVGRKVEVEIVSPHDLHHRDALESVALGDGLLLPGGSDMGEVEGQVAAAAQAFHKRVPTLGVCLGMQSMVVSLTRTLLALPGANLEEVDATAETLVFKRLRGTDGTPQYRLGAHQVRVNPGTRFAKLCGRSEIPVRMAHRYHLSHELLPPLLGRGLAIGGQSEDGRVIDAVEFPAHPFFVGIQGHPEYSSRTDDPAGLLTGFLDAAGRHKLSRKPLDD